MKLTLSTKSSLKRLDAYGTKFDEELKEMKKTHTETDSVPAESSGKIQAHGSDGSFKIVLDNIDLRIITRDMTCERQNKDIHWVNHSAVMNRVTMQDKEREQIDLLDLDNCKILPTVADHHDLRRDFTHLISRIVVEHLPCLNFLQSVCRAHIPHKYTREMSQKSEKVCVGYA